MKNYLLTLIALTLLASCASATKKEIEQEKKQYSNIQTREQMVDNAKTMLEESTELTEAEKDKLANLFAEVSQQSAQLNAEISQSKTVLFHEVTSKSYDEKKTIILKNSIKKLYDKKIDLMMDAFKKSQKILGIKKAPQKFHHEFLFLDNQSISFQ